MFQMREAEKGEDMSLLSPQKLREYFEQAQMVQFGEVRYTPSFRSRTNQYKAIENLVIQILGKIVRGNGIRDKLENRQSNRIRFHSGNIDMEWRPDPPKRQKYRHELADLRKTEEKYGRSASKTIK